MSCTVQDIQVDPREAGVCGPLRGGRLRLRAQKKSFLQRDDREWDPYGGSGLSGSGHHIAVDMDVDESPSNQDFWDQVECIKILEVHGRDFCLLVLVESGCEGSGDNSVLRRVGRAEIYAKKIRYNLPLLHGQHFGPGPPGYVETKRCTYFEGCSMCIFDLV